MRPGQIVAVGLSVLLNALDGFDVLAISFASPGIASEWGIDRAALGIVLSMELIGMALGSVALGNVADRIGRRRTILGCLVVMALGMFFARSANGVETMSAYRFITGLGIGGMLAAINAVAAEFANNRRRNLAVTIMAAGYPAGAIIGGTIASQLLATGSWRAVFTFGAIVTAACIPLVWFLLPESISYLMQRRPPDALERINAILARLGHKTVAALPAVTAQAVRRSSLLELFAPRFARTTMLLTAAYFSHIMTFYFTLKWIPKIVVDMGFEPSSAGGVLVWANVGGISGALVFSVLTQRIGLRPLLLATFMGTFVMVTLFGRSSADLGELALLAGCAGFFSNAAIVGLYAMFAQSFPTALRASGTGFAIGFGRAGAALGPIAAGFLFVAGATLPSVAFMMALGALVAAVAIFFLNYQETDIP
jgi:benzoate transport